MVNLSGYVAEIFLLATLLVFWSVYHRQALQRPLVLLISGEQCITYLLVYCLWSTPLVLKIVLSLMYFGFSFMILWLPQGRFLNIVSRIYLGVGIYHTLLVLEPPLIGLFFNSGQGITPFIHLFHTSINIGANITLILLVIFGGLNRHERRKFPLRRPSLSTAQYYSINPTTLTPQEQEERSR